MRIGTLLQFAGGRIGAVASSGLVAGIVIVAAGATPGQLFANYIRHPPSWVPWVSPALVILGALIIGTSLRYNVWSQRQIAIDSLAEDISFAISDLVNRQPKPATEEDIAKWDSDFRLWCETVSKKLENRAFFTRADQLHFDRLGFIQPVSMTGHDHLDWLLSQLRLKFDRLRDVINWSQERRR
jgi:hypothetical protein